VVTLERLQRQLLLWLDALGTHLLHLHGEDLLGGLGGIDTVCLDGNDDTAADLEEEMGVETDDTCYSEDVC